MSASDDLSREELISLARTQDARIVAQDAQIAELTAANEALAARLARVEHLLSRNSAAAIAADLIAWLQIHALDGELATAEPKRLRYQLLHTAARLTHGQRHRWLRIPATWPWAIQLSAAFTRITAIPAPG